MPRDIHERTAALLALSPRLNRRGGLWLGEDVRDDDPVTGRRFLRPGGTVLASTNSAQTLTEIHDLLDAALALTASGVRRE